MTLFCTTVQEKVAPGTLDVRAILVDCPLSIVCEEGVAVTEGIGFTVTVTIIGVPLQVAVGVIVYTAVPGTFAVAVNVCAMVAPEPAEAPVTLVSTTVQAKVVPITLEVSEIPVVSPVQMFSDEGVAVATGEGLTVTLTLIGVPAHPLAVGVTV